MAKIVTAFDTKTKEFSVAVDDQQLSNVSSVEFYGLGDEKAYCEVTTFETTEDKDMVKITRLVADEAESSEHYVSDELLSLAKYYRS